MQTSGPFTLYIDAGTDPAASVTLKIQLSEDGTTWFDATTTIVDLDTTQQQFISGVDLLAQRARLNFTANSAASPIELKATFFYSR